MDLKVKFFISIKKEISVRKNAEKIWSVEIKFWIVNSFKIKVDFSDNETFEGLISNKGLIKKTFRKVEFIRFTKIAALSFRKKVTVKTLENSVRKKLMKSAKIYQEN